MRTTLPPTISARPLALKACAFAAALLLAGAPAAAQPAPDTAPPGRIDLGLPRPANGIAKAQPGNPLWSIPLSSLTATRDRPLFAPSRRPPAEDKPAASEPDAPEPDAPASGPASPPNLTLVGTIAGPDTGFAIFQETGSDTVVRLRTGQKHDGWTLESVAGRSVTFTRDGESATLSLPEREGGATARDITPDEAQTTDSPAEPDAPTMEPQGEQPAEPTTDAPEGDATTDMQGDTPPADANAPADGDGADTASPEPTEDAAPQARDGG